MYRESAEGRPLPYHHSFYEVVMDLSVIIPAHGREDLLTRCLRSLDRTLQGNFDYEVCVVDDGSGMVEDQVRADASVEYPLRWLAFPERRGRSAARNEGVRIASGEIVVFLDSDMEAREGFLRAHMEAHRAKPRTAVIGRILWPGGSGFLRYIGSRGVVKLAPGATVPPWYFVTGNASVRRTDLPGEQPFDESIPGWGGEDLGLGMELARAGVRFAHAPGAVSYHHFTGDLDGHMKRTFGYGRGSVPVLAGRYPELRNVLRLGLLDSAAWRFLVSDAVFRPLYAMARTLDALPLPASLYNYLTFAAYARGYLAREQSPGAPEQAKKKD